MNSRLLHLGAVVKRTGLSSSAIYERIARGRFPREVVLSERAIGWDEDEIHDWILDQLEAQHRGR